VFKVLDKMTALVEESYNKAQQLDRDLKAKQVELNLTRANGSREPVFLGATSQPLASLITSCFAITAEVELKRQTRRLTGKCAEEGKALRSRAPPAGSSKRRGKIDDGLGGRRLGAAARAAGRGPGAPRQLAAGARALRCAAACVSRWGMALHPWAACARRPCRF
jgi:hypothetical protein